MANLTIEAGNFVPRSRGRADSIKAETLVQFYRNLNYDAIGLSSHELNYGFAEWKMAKEVGLPVVCANIFSDIKLRKPVFAPYLLKNDHGHKLGVLGFVSEKGWKARTDTSAGYFYKSPFEMSKTIKKVAKKCDHLTVMGEFSITESESLAVMFPEIDLIVSTGVTTGERPREAGNAVIVGTQQRGGTGNYVEWNFIQADSLLRYKAASQALDESLPVDSTVQDLLAKMNQKINNPAGH